MKRKVANPIKYTRQDRAKINKTKKIKSRVSAIAVSKKVDEREKQILQYLKKVSSVIDCPALGDRVNILRKGIDETANRARLSVKSTMVALNLEEALKNASYIKPLKPKKNRSQSCFRKMHLLICPIKGIGYAKIIIGEFYKTTGLPSKYAHYCATHISLHELKM